MTDAEIPKICRNCPYEKRHNMNTVTGRDFLMGVLAVLIEFAGCCFFAFCGISFAISLFADCPYKLAYIVALISLVAGLLFVAGAVWDLLLLVNNFTALLDAKVEFKR